MLFLWICIEIGLESDDAFGATFETPEVGGNDFPWWAGKKDVIIFTRADSF